MESKKEQLLSAVKAAVSRYGVEGATTRSISEIAGVNDAYIYRYFKDRDDLLAQSYMQQSMPLIERTVDMIDFCHLQTKLHLAESISVVFHVAWRQLLSDSDACRFCVFYYNSAHFKDVSEFHAKQVEQLYNSLDWLFYTKEEAKNVLYGVFTNLFVFAKQVVDGVLPNTPETEQSVEHIIFGMVLHNSNRLEKYRSQDKLQG